MMILLTFIGSQAEKEEMNSFTGTGSYWWHIIMYLILGGSFVYSLLVESKRSTGVPFERRRPTSRSLQNDVKFVPS